MAALFARLHLFVAPHEGEESAKWEKISAISPDKKFAMRIVCDSKPEDPENIDAGSVKAVEIVSLPGKEVVGSLSAGE